MRHQRWPDHQTPAPQFDRRDNISAMHAQLWLNNELAAQTAHKPLVSRVEEGLFVGNIARVQDQDLLVQMGITAVINILSHPVSNNPYKPQCKLRGLGQPRLWHQIDFRLYWNEMSKLICKEYEAYCMNLGS